nr:DUF4062 domain-containing protein [Paenibacillus konkukensis]
MSSVGQDELKSIRNAVFDELTAMGHAPLMYERNFGPWDSHQNPLQKCLDKVEESDIFLLFIKDKGGTFYPAYDRTITHLEYIQAARLNKTILVFVESGVKHSYFSQVKPVMERIADNHMEKTGGYPKAAEFVTALQAASGIPPHIDPYVWFFIDDLVKKGIYFEELSLGVSIHWKEYFSDLLRRGVLLLPLERTFDAYMKQIQAYEEFHQFIDHCAGAFQTASQEGTIQFLAALMDKLKGGIVRHHYGNLFAEDIGTFQNCSALTIYERSGNRLNLAFVTGAITSEPYYEIDNEQSYVSITAQRANTEQLFFREEKQMLYLTVKCRDRILTCHFLADSSWNTGKFVSFRDDILYAIMDQNPMILEFARKMIGGMRL